jgi:uncharacterized SAM-binding protein YcdF (DUF218 family)
VLPTGVVVALLIFAVIRKSRWLSLYALTTLYVFSVPFASNRLLHHLETRYAPMQLDQAPTADAIVALSGFTGPPVRTGYPLNINETGERLEVGIALWQRKKAPWLVFTGGQVPWQKNREVEGVIARRVAVDRGVPVGNIIVSKPVTNTSDEAQALAQLMTEHHWNRIILITSANHMPRAAALFRKAHIGFTAFPVDYRVDVDAAVTLLDFLPNAAALNCSEVALREWYGVAYYSLFPGN